MLKFKFLLILIAACVFAQGQTASELKSSRKKFQVERFFPATGEYIIHIPMSFNASTLSSTTPDFSASEVKSVALVYTQFRLSSSFDQNELNRSRVKELMTAFPGLKSNNEINWYTIEQTGCSAPTPCQDFFHGFEITLRNPEEDAATLVRTKLTEFYSSVLTGDTTSRHFLDSIVSTGTTSVIKECDSVLVSKPVRNRLGKLMPRKKRAALKFNRQMNSKLDLGEKTVVVYVNKRRRIDRIDGLSESDQRTFMRYFNRAYRIRSSMYRGKMVHARYTIQIQEDGLLNRKEPLVMVQALDNLGLSIPDIHLDEVEEVEWHCRYVDTADPGGGNTDEVVYKALDRLKDLKDCLVVTDVTGSMSPYLGQFIAWHQLHLKTMPTRDFLFFNDGDNQPDNVKKVGQVGGLYRIQTRSYAELRNQLLKAQSNGAGGDTPENNIEAILEGVRINPSIKQVIMIADNWATPRDLELLNQVKVPIRLILCGTWAGINTDYLDMIKKNGGSIHTIKSDIENLQKLNEGEVIDILGVSYMIKDGRFIRVGDGLSSM
jgi:hypothetical protein